MATVTELANMLGTAQGKVDTAVNNMNGAGDDMKKMVEASTALAQAQQAFALLGEGISKVVKGAGDAAKACARAAG